MIFVFSHFDVFTFQKGRPKPRKGLEIKLPRRNFDPPNLSKGPIPTKKKGPKGVPFWVLGDAGAPKLAEDRPCIHNGVTLCSAWDHMPVYDVMLKSEEGRCYEKKEEEKAWVGWQPRDEGARIECKKKVVYPKDGFRKDRLETIQKKTEDAAREIAHTTKLKRDREERAVARSLRPDEKRVLRRQARKARATHLVNAACRLAREEF